MSLYTELRQQRDKDLLACFNDCLRSANSVSAASDMLVNMPAPRFYVSAGMVWRNLSLFRRGKKPHDACKRKMLAHLAKEQDRASDYTFAYLCKLLEGPAPSFYIVKTTATVRVYRLLRERRKNGLFRSNM